MGNNVFEKLILSLAFICLMFINSSFDSYAEEDKIIYEVPEVSMTLSIPSNIRVVTVGIKQNDPLFADGTFDYIQTMSEIRDGNDYLLGRDLDNTFKIELVLEENSNGISDFQKLSDKKQNSILNDIVVEKNTFLSEIYTTESFTFIEYDRNVKNDNKSNFSREYFTIYNKQNIIIKITANNGNLTDYEKYVIKEIVDSANFPEKQSWKFPSNLKFSVFFPLIVITIVFIYIVRVKLIERKAESKENDKQENKPNSKKNSETQNNIESEEMEDDFYEAIDLAEAIANFEEK